jgi:hypothetical protein
LINVLTLKVAARYQQIEAAQQQGQKRRTQKLVTPINPPRGINRGLTRDEGEPVPSIDESVEPERRDLEPSDLFKPLPRHVSVRNLVETGKDLSKAVKQIPRDKGYEAVKNLSQYLIRTESK